MKYLNITVLIIFLSSCATTLKKQSATCKKNNCKSILVSKKLTTGVPEIGVVYSLPKQPLNFVITRTKVTKESLQNKLNTIKEKHSELNNKLNSISKVLIPMINERIKNLPDGVNKNKLLLELEIAEIDKLIIKKSVKEAEKDKQQTQIDFDDFKNEHFNDSFKFVQLPLIPDSSNRLVAKLNKTSFSSDTIEIKTSKDGLLSGGTGKSEGQVDEIFVALANAITTLKYAKKGSRNKSGGVSFMPPKDQKECKAGTFQHNIELKDIDKGTMINDKMQNRMNQNCFYYIVKLIYPNDIPTEESVLKDKIYYDGLIYPRTTTLRFDISKNTGQYVGSFYPSIIDITSLGIISLNKALFANNDYEFEFKDGMLTRYKAISPSGVVSFLGMFPAAAREILSIPAEIIQLKINHSTKDAAYYDAQVAAMNARRAYEQSLETDE